jgi:hypothetical protein
MKTVYLLVLSVIVSICALTSCEGYRCGNGRALDKVTNKPLDSVFCEVLTGSKTMYTDSTGKFNLCNNFGGCAPCKDITIQFSKTGYKTTSVENPVDAIIYLER